MRCGNQQLPAELRALCNQASPHQEKKHEAEQLHDNTCFHYRAAAISRPAPRSFDEPHALGLLQRRFMAKKYLLINQLGRSPAQSPSAAVNTICELLALPAFHWEPATVGTPTACLNASTAKC